MLFGKIERHCGGKGSQHIGLNPVPQPIAQHGNDAALFLYFTGNKNITTNFFTFMIDLLAVNLNIKFFIQAVCCQGYFSFGFFSGAYD
jgi:hypothetical protein